MATKMSPEAIKETRLAGGKRMVTATKGIDRDKAYSIEEAVKLMGSDAPPGRYEEPKGFSVSLQVKDPADAERIFRALAEKGTVRMPLEKTFWAQRFGMLVDRFGIPWMVNCD